MLKKIQYDRNACAAGIVHVGVGAFHRAHQAAYINNLLKIDSQQGWGIIGVNLRPQDSSSLSALADQDHRYILKTMSPENKVDYLEIGSILSSYDWTVDPEGAASVASNDAIHMITMTVTESGYYLFEDGSLDLSSPHIIEGLKGKGSCIYTYLRAALNLRREREGGLITLLSCDNLRDNGKKLKSGFQQFLLACEDKDLLSWVDKNVTFPCCVVDRITPRLDPKHASEVQEMFDVDDHLTVVGESFSQWVIENNFAGKAPRFDLAGVEVVDDVSPYEEAKIRILNGGHTILAYLAALKGYTTYDEGMCDPELNEFFIDYQLNDVIPAIETSPIDLDAYSDMVKIRFSNKNIADSVSRICADGVNKFSIFILVTLEAAYSKRIVPKYALQGVASWYVFMRHVKEKRIPFEYVEPNWSVVEASLEEGGEMLFARNTVLWGNLPEIYPNFIDNLLSAIDAMKGRFPI